MMSKYYIFEDGTVKHEDDFSPAEPKPDNLEGIYSVYDIPDEVFKHIHNNAVHRCIYAVENKLLGNR